MYAPELKFAGVAAGGVPADLDYIARHIDGGPFAGIYVGAAVGLSRAYPEIDTDTLLNTRGIPFAEKTISTPEDAAEFGKTEIGDDIVLGGFGDCSHGLHS